MSVALPKPNIGDWVEKIEEPVPGLNPQTGDQVCLSEATMHRCRAGYYGLINHVDDQIGRLFKGLSDGGFTENTWIVFVSDHGEMLGDHQLFNKALPYDPVLRIPLSITPPMKLDHNFSRSVCMNEPVGLCDIMPTLLDIAGAEIPNTVDGMSLLTLMLNSTDQKWNRSYIHCEHATTDTPAIYGCTRHFRDASQCVTDGREKYIWWSQTGREQFFDLLEDPMECHDLIEHSQHGSRVDVWRERLISELEGRPEGFANKGKLEPVDVEKLPAIIAPFKPKKITV
jgi:arylsulfatase A-like enzyme